MNSPRRSRRPFRTWLLHFALYISMAGGLCGAQIAHLGHEVRATLSPAFFLAAQPAGAQPSPSPNGALDTPPMRVHGTALLGGLPAPPGTPIVALVGSSDCTVAPPGGSTAVGAAGTFEIDVMSASNRPGCGTNGATVFFMIGGASATQTTTWQQGAVKE